MTATAQAPAVRSITQAALFVKRSGVALAFASDDLVLPSLWEAAYGDRELVVFRVDERGKRVLTDELKHVWSLKNRLGAERRACVGKHVSRRVALIDLSLLPSFYALTGRAGRPDDFRDDDDRLRRSRPLQRRLRLRPLSGHPLDQRVRRPGRKRPRPHPPLWVRLLHSGVVVSLVRRSGRERPCPGSLLPASDPGNRSQDRPGGESGSAVVVLQGCPPLVRWR